jgi:hypothetical protein
MIKLIKNQRKQLISEYFLSDDYINTLMSLCKQRLGIMSDVKDDSIEARILASILALAKERNITVDPENTSQMMFLVDFACYQYTSLNNTGAMPIDLRYRLNNLFIGGINNDI